MKAKFVDTNIFLEVFARKGEKSNQCLALVERGTPLWTSIFVISEIEWVLRSGYELKKGEIILYLKRVFALPNLKIEKRKILLWALELYENNKVDWVDCINALLIKRTGIKDVYSYDRHFDNFDWVRRLEPQILPVGKI